MLQRDAMRQIELWKSTKTHQALLIDGARQVGKTTIVREFARSRYDVYIEINFLENRDAIGVLAGASNAADLFLRITALSDKEVVPGRTLVLFDEIQEFGDILTWAKFLVERTDVDYVFSGSLLGVDLAGVRSWPVGFMETLTMFPLSFSEFCRACGVQQRLLDEARACLDSERPVPDFIHSKLLAAHARYLFCGGMPDAVQRFVDTNDAVALRRAHQGIWDLYEYDIARHMKDNEAARFVKATYEAIPGELNKPNKRFILSKLGRQGSIHTGDLRFSRMESSFDWLAHAGVALPVLRVTEPQLPLGLTAQRSAFKLFMNDVGLLMFRLTGNAALDVLRGRTSMNYGAPYENYVAQELACHGRGLFYYNDSKRGEVDFVVEDSSQANVTLVEVKSGKDYKRHNALNNLLATPGYDFDRAVVLHDGNVGREGRVLYAPVYMAGML